MKTNTTTKRLVATHSRDFDRKASAIHKAVSSQEHGATPKEISRLTKINVNTIKSILPKLPLIRREQRGLYIVDKGGDGGTPPNPLFQWNFHNTVMTSPHSLPMTQNPYSESLNLDLLKLEITHEKEKAYCRTSTDYPLNITSITLVAYTFCVWLNNRFNTEIRPKDIVISCIEFNKDYENLKLEGANSLSIDNLTSQFKLYQKKHGVRIEHKTKIPISVQSVTDMLNGNPYTTDVQVKLNQQTENLARVAEQTAKNTQLLMSLIRKIRGDERT